MKFILFNRLIEVHGRLFIGWQNIILADNTMACSNREINFHFVLFPIKIFFKITPGCKHGGCTMCNTTCTVNLLFFTLDFRICKHFVGSKQDKKSRSIY